MAQWIEGRPANQRVTGLIPSQSTCLGCGPGPQWEMHERQPHTDVSPSFSLPLSLKINKSLILKKWGWCEGGEADTETYIIDKIVSYDLCGTLPQVPLCHLLMFALDPCSLPPFHFINPCFLPPYNLAVGLLSLHGPVSSPSVTPASSSPSLHSLPEANCRTSPGRPGTILPTHFLPISWCQLRAHTQSQLPSVLITHPSCHRPWSVQEALGTPGPPPSSECDLRVGRARGGGPRQLSPGLGEGAPSLPPLPPSPLFPTALMLEGAARRTWTMTQRRTPWCLPSGSGHAGGTAQSTVRPHLPHLHALPTASPQLPTSAQLLEHWPQGSS